MFSSFWSRHNFDYIPLVRFQCPPDNHTSRLFVSAHRSSKDIISSANYSFRMRISCFRVLVLSFILQLHHCEASRLRKCPSSYPSNSQSDTLTVYHDVDRLSACKETMLLDFALYNALDDPATHISIRATVGKSFGKDSAIPLPICDSPGGNSGESQCRISVVG